MVTSRLALLLGTSLLAASCGDAGSGNGSQDTAEAAASANSGSTGVPGSAGGNASTGGSISSSNTTGSSGSSATSGGHVEIENPLTDPAEGPAAGFAEGGCSVPAEAGLEDTSNPDHVIGSGTPESCTGDAFIDAVAQGGVITFDCGPEPVVVTLDRPAKVFNDASDGIVIDGGGLVTLSGGGATRILYMNTCDEAQHWTTDHCQNQDHPRLTVQNLTFID